TCGERRLGLPPQRRPRIGPGPRPRLHATAGGEVAPECPASGHRVAVMRLPQPLERQHEVPPPALRHELLRPVPAAKVHPHAVAPGGGLPASTRYSISPSSTMP